MTDNLSNRLFFRLYQTANTLTKVGTKALDVEQVTTQQWSVLGALSRNHATEGMKVSELCEYLMVSRQNMTGLLSRLEEREVICRVTDPQDQRSRRILLTDKGRDLWQRIMPLINSFYDEALMELSLDDRISCVHYLNKLLDAMKVIDERQNDQ